MGYNLEGMYNKEGILYLSSVNTNELPGDHDIYRSEYIKLCIIQYNIDIPLML